MVHRMNVKIDVRYSNIHPHLYVFAFHFVKKQHIFFIIFLFISVFSYRFIDVIISVINLCDRLGRFVEVEICV